MAKKKIGVLGGGQLGMMLQEASGELPVELHFLDPNPSCSASFVSQNLTVGSFKDKQTVIDFGKEMDILTVEIEHVSVEGLLALEAMDKKVFPSPAILRVVQDKGIQKQFYADNGIPTADFSLVSGREELIDNTPELPFVLKQRTGGYDGQGVAVIKQKEDITKAFDAPMLVEKMVPFEKEISVIVARNEAGEVRSFPTVEMDFDPEANLVDALLSPARISKQIEDEARALAERLINRLDMVGLLAVEMFLLADGGLLVNEIAPRPHNSGHQSIEGNVTSQYQQHLRSISGMPLADTSVTRPSVMINLLGSKAGSGKAKLIGADIIQADEDIYLHDYHKAETRPFRKMGHMTILADTLEAAEEKSSQIKSQVTVEPA